MRALTFARFGGPEVLEVVETETPRPAAGEVSVRVRAAGLNFFDLMVRQDHAGFPIPLPFVGGMEAVGTIEEVGAGVEGWAPGDRVLRDVTDSCRACRYCRTGQEWRCVSGAFTLNSISGAFAEVLTCRAERLVAVPDGVSDVAAAATQMSYGTAWHMLHTRAELRSGDTVLVSSVGSGLGSAAADIARAAGALVIATASTDEKLNIARERGVDHVINYRATDVREAVAEITGGVGVDIAFEHVGGDAFRAAYDSLAMDGRLVTCGWSAGMDASINLMDLCRGRKQVIGSVNRTLDDLHRCLTLISDGRLTPAIAATFPLDEARLAVELSDSRQAFGKIVLVPSNSPTRPTPAVVS